MNKITAQLAELAQQPCWEETTQQSELALLKVLTEAEEALLKEKIICFVFTPDTEEPEEPDLPKPDEPIPDKKENDDELVSVAV